jgi:signal peptidase I
MRADTKKSQGALRLVLEVVVIVVAAFAIAMLVQAFVVKPFTIHQVSMQPTLLEGDRILLNRMSYHFRDPERGDIVVFHSPVVEDEDLVKRVVAVGGDGWPSRWFLVCQRGNSRRALLAGTGLPRRAGRDRCAGG